MPRRRTALPLAVLVVAAIAPAAEPVPPGHAANMAASRKLFAEKVRPFFATTCLDCHGGAKVKSGFSLATRDDLLKGGDAGVAIVPGKGRASRLVQLVTHADDPHMPPKGPPVAKEVVEAVVAWIDFGAAYDKPLAEKAKAGKELVVTDKDRGYWAYRPLANPTPPKEDTWARTPIDRFLRAKMAEKGVTPAPDADRRTLIRRVYFDLIGLPPEPADVEAFAAAPDPDAALAAVADKLLASPQFGERWGRHWLDPARFAESHGFEHDYDRPFAYHYRDFVIKALNADVPYDRFVRWQVAGDEFAPNDPMALAATGFLGAGVYPTQITNREAERVRYDAMDDMLATTGHAVLALTVGCARCHDHKYDPIPAKDYYRMLSAFTTTVRSEVDVDLGTDAEKAATRAFEAKRKPLADEAARYEAAELPAKLATWARSTDAVPKIADPKAAAAVAALRAWPGAVGLLTKPHREAVLKWYAHQDAGHKERAAAVAAVEKQKPKDTRTKIQACTEGLKPMRHHTATGDIPDFYPQTFVLKRGDTLQKDGVADPGFLQVLTRTDAGPAAWAVEKRPESRTSYKRAALANWLVDTKGGAGALAARVIVNRLWHHHFGRGLVSTVNDFGFQGDPPTHPELLDWLANDLVQNGWQLKRLHKMIVLSRAYRLSGATTPEAMKVDPENKLLWHRPRHRLEAEAIRDNLLAVGGLLDPTMYGPGTLDENTRRRSIYFTVKRSRLIPSLQVFDWPDTLTSAAARPVTVVPPQALLFLNGPQVKAAAAGLAARVKSADPGQTVEAAYRIAFARPPSAKEREAGVAFLATRPPEEYCLVLLSLNEFITVD